MQKNEGKLAVNHFNLDEYDDENDDYQPETKRKKSSNRKVKQPIISAKYRGIDASSVEKIGEFFQDKEFCVIMGDEMYDKLTLERYIVENGGTTVQNPGNLFIIIIRL